MNTDLEPYQGGTPEPYDEPQTPAISSQVLRPRLPEIGRIRLGRKHPTKGYPQKIEAFRLTSRNRTVIEHVANQYGGMVEPWDSEEGKQWQVFTPTTELEVVVPRAHLAFSQYFELWSGGGLCERRCNGIRQTNDAPCACSPDHENIEGECKITTRLSVFLPDIPGLGLWRVESHGWSAGSEISGTMEIAAAFGIDLLPGVLTAESRGPRRIKDKAGKVTTVKYVVPVLTISQSIRQAVTRLQIVQQERLGLTPSASERASDRSMRRLRISVFTLWPGSDKPGPERDRRLAQLSTMLGRPVATISADHDLTEGEALRLAGIVDALESTPALTRGQAAPSSSPDAASAAGADSTAATGAGLNHPQIGTAAHRSAGEPREVSTASEIAAAPAEHHTAEVLGEVAPADGTVPEGRAGAIPDSPPGAAPTPDQWTRERRQQVLRERLTASWLEAAERACKAEHEADPFPCEWHIQAAEQSMEDANKPAPTKPVPTRKRRPTDRTGAPNVAQAIAEKQRFMDDRKTQTEVEHPPTNWLQALPPETVYNLMTFFQQAGANAEKVAESVVKVQARRLGVAEGDEWTPEQITQLAAATWDRSAQ